MTNSEIFLYAFLGALLANITLNLLRAALLPWLIKKAKNGKS